MCICYPYIKYYSKLKILKLIYFQNINIIIFLILLWIILKILKIIKTKVKIN